jgi:hypothetical protein
LRSDRNLFAYAQGRYSNEDEELSDNAGTGSFGFGYRQIVKDSAVLGAYVLGDYTHTAENHDIWQISPGIEALGRVWEFRANGYFPVGKKDWSDSDFADHFGNYDYIYFNDHTQYDAIFTYHEEAGIGTDAEVGRKLFTVDHVVVKGYVGGYFFDMKHNDNVTGGDARITFQKSRSVKLSIRDSYDNYDHNTFMVGVQLSLYDLFGKNRSEPMDENNLQPKLFDPIDRNFAEIADGSDVVTTGGPHTKGYPGNKGGNIEPGKPSKPEIKPGVPEEDNVWFFKPDSPQDSQVNAGPNPGGPGTPDNPFVGLNQTYLDEVKAASNSPAKLYFAQGSYNAVGPIIDGYAGLRVSSYKALYGRMKDPANVNDPNNLWAAQATGNNRPVFNGGLVLASNTAINDLIFHATSNVPVGIILSAATDVDIADVDVGVNPDAPEFNANLTYGLGILMINNSSVTLDQSNIYGYSADSAEGEGIEVHDGGSIKAINHSLIKGAGYSEGLGLDLEYVNDSDYRIGDITGDKTATFIGEGLGSGIGFGFAAGNGDADVHIGSIAGVKFEGKGVGNTSFAFEANGANTVTIGSITNSIFDANGGFDILLRGSSVNVGGNPYTDGGVFITNYLTPNADSVAHNSVQIEII